MFLIDTNVICELRRPREASRKLADWAASTPLSKIFLSLVSICELEVGALSTERKDRAQGRSLRGWINAQVSPSFKGRILPIDLAAAERCAALNLPERDALIAATALAHDLTLVTRDASVFEAAGVRVFNPWD